VCDRFNIREEGYGSDEEHGADEGYEQHGADETHGADDALAGYAWSHV
jgi:hypothetical protein